MGGAPQREPTGNFAGQPTAGRPSQAAKDTAWSTAAKWNTRREAYSNVLRATSLNSM